MTDIKLEGYGVITREFIEWIDTFPKNKLYISGAYCIGTPCHIELDTIETMSSGKLAYVVTLWDGGDNLGTVHAVPPETAIFMIPYNRAMFPMQTIRSYVLARKKLPDGGGE